MDLGLAGRKAIVCAASKGLGRGCATALAREGCEVVIAARNAGPLEDTAQAIRRATGARVHAVEPRRDSLEERFLGLLRDDA